MNDERTTAYLLEELTAAEAEQFEEQCFDQETWPAGELESAEQDLIEAYIRKELSPERERRFEKNYLTTTARKDRVLLTRSILRVVCSKPSLTQRALACFKMVVSGSWLPIPRFATAVLAVGLAATLLWFSMPPKSPPPKAPQTFADINLQISNDTRSTNEQAKIVNLPISQDALRISLALPARGPSDFGELGRLFYSGRTYRVQWEDIKGPLEELKIEKQDDQSILVIIPTDKLRPGQYAVKLFRRNEDGTEQRVSGSYVFEVR